ncbi:hypothetical protein BDU57DRAFT_148718 [Ampelomyces quisqualis]|uniref:Uncharacterized protein n=1 Tax=Ampelomyces quisqualis TaxID=50730 RepID=A0A6A5QW15_AMPQU|nr:hypothetical protein BDU57DRAFT_148718 [Ampelomyces quisqualis]
MDPRASSLDGKTQPVRTRVCFSFATYSKSALVELDEPCYRRVTLSWLDGTRIRKHTVQLKFVAVLTALVVMFDSENQGRALVNLLRMPELPLDSYQICTLSARPPNSRHHRGVFSDADLQTETLAFVLQNPRPPLPSVSHICHIINTTFQDLCPRESADLVHVRSGLLLSIRLV